jgi:uncharacterized protein YjbI with pentapeptide repeats
MNGESLKPDTSQEEPYTTQDIHDFLKDGQSLEYADLSGSKLIGVHLPKISFKGASLQGADLRYANLAGAIFEEANLKGADLTGAKLTGADLSGANLEGAILSNANLVRTDLSGACFKDAKLIYTSLRTATISQTDFTGADLRGVNLSGAKECLTAIFNNADLRGARFDYTQLDKVDLQNVGAKVYGNEQGLKNYLLSLPVFGK